MTKKSNLPIALGLIAFLIGSALVVLVLRSDGDDGDERSGATRERTVLVASEALSAGASGRQLVADGLVVAQPAGDGAVGSDVLTSVEELRGQTLSTAVEAGQPLRRADLRPETLRRDAITIPDGKQAVAIQVPFVSAGGGYVGPGDRVNLYGRIADAPGGPVVRLVLPDVEVLDVSTEVAPRRAAAPDQRGDRPTGTQVTYLFALDAHQAAQAIFLAGNESLWVTLVPQGQAPAGELTVDRAEVLR